MVEGGGVRGWDWDWGDVGIGGEAGIGGGAWA